MLCSYCGATASPTLDRCVVCNTPYPAHFVEGPTSLSAGTDPSSDETRLTAESAEQRRAAPPSGRAGGDPVLSPGQTFANRYTIIRMLGAGGMAAVYQAWDETLAIAVALKLIRADPSIDRADLVQLEQRFKRELKLARQVTHPNVVRIHDLGEVGGTLYLTMEYVQGSDLATVLQRDGRLPIARVLTLGRQIVSGLAAAHRAGVVHRDLKPANIMVDANDQALLTDFGIARSKTGEQPLVTDAGIVRQPPGSTLHTTPGAIMGTLEYMAPEQLRAEPADERTDIFAVGLILYEAMAGSRRPAGNEAFPDLLARIQKGPAPLLSVVPEVPAEVDRIVSKCLKTDPAERYASADELLTDLEGLDAEGNPLPVARRVPRWKVVTAASVLSAILIGATWYAASTQMPPIPPTERDPMPVLIVDFENRTQDAVFEGALEQALSVAMEGAPFVTAYPRKDAAGLVQSLKLGAKLDESTGRLLATREGIRVILAGAIERRGDGYRITVRAIDPEKPDPIKVASEDAGNKGEVLAAVNRVADPLREALGDTPSASAQQEGETFTAASFEAVRAYIEAQELAANQKDVEAVAKFDEAIKYDPQFARAYVGKANSEYYLGRADAAKETWTKAFELMDRMTEREKLRTNGTYLAGLGRDYAGAIDTYDTLVERYPADSAGYNNLAVAHFSTLNFAEALKNGRKAIDIYPKSFKYRANYALYAMYASDFSLAAETAKKLIEEDPNFDTAYLPLAMDALAAGDTGRARAAYEQASKTGDAGASLAAMGLADIAMFEGRYDDAIAALPAAAGRDTAQENQLGAAAKLVALAEAHAARGNARAAADAFAKARVLSTGDGVLVPAGRFAVATGRIADAKEIIALLEKGLPAQTRAYAKLIESDMSLAKRDYPAAIGALRDAGKLADAWLLRYALGLAYFERGDYIAATQQLENCQQRRGEVTALFLDDLPTYRYYAAVPYWLGRTREMRGQDPRTQYQEFLAIRGGGAPDDPLVRDARRRLEALGKLP